MKYIYLNNAATSYPKPAVVLKTINDKLKIIPVDTRRDGLSIDTGNEVYKCREKLCRFFNAENAENIIFTSGATESLNTGIFGLGLNNVHVITSVTEHNSVIRPLKYLEKNNNVAISWVSCDQYGRIAADDISKLIKTDTAAVIINHASNVTGYIQDIQKISSSIKKINNNILFIVDASQSAGMSEIDLKNTGIDILAFTGHKSLYGMRGIGGFYLKKGVNLNPLKHGGTGVKSESLYQPDILPIKYEAGTPNVPGITSMAAGTDFIIDTGLKKIINQKKHILSIAYEKLSHIDKVELVSGPDIDNNCGVISFVIKGFKIADVCYIIQKSFGIIIRSGLHCAPMIHKFIGTNPEGTLRISPSFFTKEKDISRFINSIKQIVKM